MTRRNIIILVAGISLGLLAVGAFAAPYLLPERSTQVDEALDAGVQETILKRGTFRDGEPGHTVRGTIEIVLTADGHYLRFTDYRQTAGPDVFVYLTTTRNADDTSEVESGLRVRIDGGADGGESTKTGDFVQRLPDGFDPARWHGVTIWCDQWNVYFGGAALDP